MTTTPPPNIAQMLQPGGVVPVDIETTAALIVWIKRLEQARADLEAEVQRLQRIAWLIGEIFVHGNFKAETHNESELEKLLRENGTFWESLADFEATAALENKP